MTLRTLDQGGPSNVPEYLKRSAVGNVIVSIMVGLPPFLPWSTRHALIAVTRPYRTSSGWEGSVSLAEISNSLGASSSWGR